MPRYYFDIHARPVLRDDTGEEFQNLDSAKEHAIHVARQLSSRSNEDASITHTEIIVRDEVGEVFRLKLTPN
jgi:Domain of unknown function (DUF6894)